MSGLFQDDPQIEAPPPPDGPSLFGEPAHAAPYRVLARKYRPTRFDDLIGQETMVRILRNAFATGRVAHAFMLTGVRGVGKTTTARIIARALNCTGPDGQGGPTADPCGVCANCVAILADRHPDVVEMDAASRTGVDDVREIIEATRYRPIQARAKVFIVDEVHMLSRNAFNALLKTLEEPPPHVKFVFATTELRKVPVTVLSRCQRFDLRRVRMAELAAHFGRIAAQEKVLAEPVALEVIARAADGSVRDGLSLLDQAIAQSEDAVTEAAVVAMLGLADRGLVFDLMDAVMSGQPRQALQVTEAAHERGADLGMLLQDLLELVYTVTRLKSVPALRDSHDLSEAERTRGAALADRLSVPVLARAWQMLLKGVAEVETAPDRRAAAEMVLIRLCHVAELPPPGDLVRRLSGGTASGSGVSAPGPSGGGVRAVAGGAPVAAPCRGAQAGELPRRDRAGRRMPRGDAACPPGAFGARGALRPAGDRAAAAAGGAEGPRGTVGRAADRGDRHALDDRAVDCRGRAHGGGAGQRRRCGAARGGGRPPAGARHHGCVSRRADRHGARHRRRRLWSAGGRRGGR